jgi:RND superfamily putative drug exporter
MPRLSRFLLGHKLAVVAAWLLVLVAGMAAAGAVSSRLSQDFSLPGQEGYEANVAILRAYGTGGPGNPLVPVVTLSEGLTVDSPGVQSALAAAFGGLAEDRRVRVLAWPATTDDRRLVVDGGRTVYGLVWGPYQPGLDEGASGLAPAVAGRLRAALPAGSSIQVTGLDELVADTESQPGDTGVLVETLVGGVGALVVLAFVFGSLLALVPLLVAGVSILAAFLAVYGLTLVTDVSFLVQFLVALIGLGVAIDYSLLLVTRWREERQRGHDREQAVHRAMATAGRSVVTSAGTVAVSLLVLVLLPVPFLRSVGYGGLLIPLASAVVALTLLPVLLATVGPRLDWPAGRLAERKARLRRERSASRLWTRWAGGVVRHRWLASLAALAVLLPLGWRRSACGSATRRPTAWPAPARPATALPAWSAPASAAASSPRSRCWSRRGPTPGRPPAAWAASPACRWRPRRRDRPGAATAPPWSPCSRPPGPAPAPAKRPWSGSATWPPPSCPARGSAAAARWASTRPAPSTAPSR